MWMGDGILDLSEMMRSTDYVFKPEYLQENQSRFLYLRIDRAFPSSTICKSLNPYLGGPQGLPGNLSLHENTSMNTFPYHPGKNPPITGVPAWLKYFMCYDLRQRPGQKPSYGDVGKCVYGGPEGPTGHAVRGRQSIYDQAKRAYKKVKQLIRLAENISSWPPRSLLPFVLILL